MSESTEVVRLGQRVGLRLAKARRRNWRLSLSAPEINEGSRLNFLQPCKSSALKLPDYPDTRIRASFSRAQFGYIWRALDTC